jgi:hypothetical protein
MQPPIGVTDLLLPNCCDTELMELRSSMISSSNRNCLAFVYLIRKVDTSNHIMQHSPCSNELNLATGGVACTKGGSLRGVARNLTEADVVVRKLFVMATTFLRS